MLNRLGQSASTQQTIRENPSLPAIAMWVSSSKPILSLSRPTAMSANAPWASTNKDYSCYCHVSASIKPIKAFVVTPCDHLLNLFYHCFSAIFIDLCNANISCDHLSTLTLIANIVIAVTIISCWKGDFWWFSLVHRVSSVNSFLSTGWFVQLKQTVDNDLLASHRGHPYLLACVPQVAGGAVS